MSDELRTKYDCTSWLTMYVYVEASAGMLIWFFYIFVSSLFRRMLMILELLFMEEA